MDASRLGMPDLAPEVFRQRLLIEGRFGGEMTEARLRSYLLGLAAHLGLRTYGEPVVHAPAAGMGRAENAGFDAFVPLIDSGIAAYVWSGPRFFSVVLFTCKGFDEAAAVAFTRDAMAVEGDIAAQGF